LVKRTSYQAPHYTVFTSLLPLPPTYVQIFALKPSSQINKLKLT